MTEEFNLILMKDSEHKSLHNKRAGSSLISNYSQQENGTSCKPDKVRACNNLHAADKPEDTPISSGLCSCRHEEYDHGFGIRPCIIHRCPCKKFKEVSNENDN